MDAPGHYSSAYDMALLARYAMRNESFRKMAGAQTFVGDDYVLKNANRLIGYYAGADGVKIGFTDNARKTIVATATRDGHRVYVSLMRSEDLVSDSIALFEWVWENFRWP
jgi:D-alanyl-D-alanine carboxypeptidase